MRPIQRPKHESNFDGWFSQQANYFTLLSVTFYVVLCIENQLERIIVVQLDMTNVYITVAES